MIHYGLRGKIIILIAGNTRNKIMNIAVRYDFTENTFFHSNSNNIYRKTLIPLKGIK